MKLNMLDAIWTVRPARAGRPLLARCARRWPVRIGEVVHAPRCHACRLARKPRSWGENPIRGIVPESVHDLLDRMAPERFSLISDIRHAGMTYGFPAAADAGSATVKAVRTIYVCSIGIWLSRHLEFSLRRLALVCLTAFWNGKVVCIKHHNLRE